jgi:drug/metabolite transporter (DMT)-like permease
LTYLITPIVIVMAWLLLGEVPTALVLGGGVLCVVGVVVARTGGWSWRRVLGRAPGG